MREVASGAEVTVYDQAPSLRGRFDSLYGNYSEMATNFNGLDITLNKRLSHRWMMMGSVSFGRSKGDIYGGMAANFLDLNDPNNSFRRGLIDNDVPFSFKLFGMYQLPYGISLSGTVQHFTGFPELTTRVGRRQYRRADPRDAARHRRAAGHDTSAGRQPDRFQPQEDVHPRPRTRSSRSWTCSTSPMGRPSARDRRSWARRYGVASDVVRGRIIKFGLNVKF